MVAPLLLLASLIIPSALQQQTETVDQKLVALSEWLGEWRTYSSDAQVQLADNQVETGTQLDKVVAKAEGVRAQLEDLIEDFVELVKIAQATQNETSQLLTDLQVLKGRQAVAGAVQGTQVFMFLAYLATIAVFYLVKHCRKHQGRVAREEFELLETKLQASRSKHRAAAARTGKQSPQ